MTTSVAGHAQPAPNLTDLQIAQVTSTNGGSESVTPSQSLTNLDHGGSQITVVVQEIGYSSTRRATWLGTALPSSALVSSQNLCGTTSAPSTSCPAGSSIIGFRKTWQFANIEPSGRFAVTNTSVNGGGSRSDSIQIK